MEQCIICKNKTNWMNQHKILNGYICTPCFKRIPSIVHEHLHEYNDLRIRMIVEYFDKTKKLKFEPNANYGDLHIDELNGMFSIKSNSMEFIINTLDIKELGILTSDVKADRNDKVKCTIELDCTLESPDIKFKVPIKKNLICKSARVNNATITYNIPGEIEIIRQILNQTIKNAVDRYNKKINPSGKVSKHEIDLIKAKALFMIEDYYDNESLKRTRDLLVKVYHPDNKLVMDESFIKKIYMYYDLLMEELEGK